MDRGWVYALLWPSALALIALCTAHGVHAQDSEEQRKTQAKQRFEQAVADYDAGRYEQALANFQEAHRLRPHPIVNVNIANCYDKLGKPLLAIFHFERFLEAKAGSQAQQAEVNSALARLRKQVGMLVLRVTPDGARVIIDAEQQRRAPILEPMQLQAGEHHLEVQLDGYQTVQRKVIVNGGARFELDIALERSPNEPAPVLALTPTAPAPPAPAPAPGSSAVLRITPAAPPPNAPLPAPVAATSAPPAAKKPASKTAAWIAGGATAALLLAGSITGILALDAKRDFDEGRDRLAATTRPLDRVVVYEDAAAAEDRAETLALTTDVLLGTALVGAVVTTVLFLSGNESEPASQPAPRSSPHPTDTGALLPF